MERQQNHVECTILCRLCRQKLTEDHRTFPCQRILDAALNKRSLFRTKRHSIAARLPHGDGVPTFLPSEMRRAVETMSKGKSPGADGITVEILLARGHKLFSALAQRFSHGVTQCEVPSPWKRSKTILLIKKGDREHPFNIGQ